MSLSNLILFCSIIFLILNFGSFSILLSILIFDFSHLSVFFFLKQCLTSIQQEIKNYEIDMNASKIYFFESDF